MQLAERDSVSAKIRLLVVIVSAFAGFACTTDSPHPISPWSFAKQTFSKRIFEAEFREKRLSQKAIDSLIFARQLHPGRYRFLHLAELVTTGRDTRTGEVAISIDGWPTTVHFTMGRQEGRWMITGVGSTDAQRRILELLGPVGLPYVDSATTWTGGLAGRDAYGRPNGSVLVVVVGGRVYIDGRIETAYRQNDITAAIDSALKTRATVAKGAYATYRPHVAIALIQNAPMMMVSDLTKWAFNAGADAVQILVRRKNNSPGWLGIGQIKPGNSTSTRVLRVRISRQYITVYAVSSDGAAPVIKIPTQKSDALSERLKRLATDSPLPNGVIIEPSTADEHVTMAKVIASIQSGLPDVPVALETR